MASGLSLQQLHRALVNSDGTDFWCKAMKFWCRVSGAGCQGGAVHPPPPPSSSQSGLVRSWWKLCAILIYRRWKPCPHLHPKLSLSCSYHLSTKGFEHWSQLNFNLSPSKLTPFNWSPFITQVFSWAQSTHPKITKPMQADRGQRPSRYCMSWNCWNAVIIFTQRWLAISKENVWDYQCSFLEMMGGVYLHR